MHFFRVGRVLECHGVKSITREKIGFASVGMVRLYLFQAQKLLLLPMVQLSGRTTLIILDELSSSLIQILFYRRQLIRSIHI